MRLFLAHSGTAVGKPLGAILPRHIAFFKATRTSTGDRVHEHALLLYAHVATPFSNGIDAGGNH